MLSPKNYLNLLITNKIDFFVGIPDSALKNFTSIL